MSLTDINKSLESYSCDARASIIGFEEGLKDIEGSFLGDSKVCPLVHRFSDQMYVREITIPADTVLVGKIHKHDHPNFLMKGRVRVVTEGAGEEMLEGPMSIISPPGTKRVLYAETELVWVTVHHNPSNTQDLKELEDLVIADSFEGYEKFKKKDNRIISKFKKLIIKKLSI